MEAELPNSEVTLLSDQEYRELHPDQEENSKRNQDSAVACQACGGDCCRVINCILYSPHLSCCPVYEYRPQGCRVRGEASCLTEAEMVELREIAEPDWIPEGIRGQMVGIMQSLNRGELSPPVAEAGIRKLVQAYRLKGS